MSTSKHGAKILLKWWAGSQNGEVKPLDYPSVTPVFREYQAGYRNHPPETDNDGLVELVGLAISQVHPAARKAIKQSFLHHKKIPRRAREWAIVAFARQFDSIA